VEEGGAVDVLVELALRVADERAVALVGHVGPGVA
jgi:hypothetical protein